MASPTDIKQILLTGTAATEMSGGTGKKERRNQKRGGDAKKNTNATTPSAPVPANISVSSSSITPASSVVHTSSVTTPSTPSIPSTPILTEGGTKTIKVELKKRTTMKRVHLQPKRADAPKGGKKSHMAPQTKRVRKVTLAVEALHKRMKRAKRMTQKVKEMSLEQLREHLIQKKLIKPTSKAPEPVLRQIAADAQIVAGKAL